MIDEIQNLDYWQIAGIVLLLLEFVLRIIPSGKSKSLIRGLVWVLDRLVPDRYKHDNNSEESVKFISQISKITKKHE